VIFSASMVLAIIVRHRRRVLRGVEEKSFAEGP
jgi:hypothetical protein